ncbi:MAG: hypothetical protein AAFZ17_01450 [Cyanobacteria bacterium J06650_10]
MSLEQQLAAITQYLTEFSQSISVEKDAAGVTLEQHSPRKGVVYTRLRARKGKVLSNGKRTMTLDAEEAAAWAQRIHERNQQAKVDHCLSLIHQAGKLASEIDWQGRDFPTVVNDKNNFTTKRKGNASSTGSDKPKLTIKYVLKNAKGATAMNRKVHAIAEDEPSYGRWYSPALCGDRPKAGSWGWRTCDPSEFDCPKCHQKLKLLN